MSGSGFVERRFTIDGQEVACRFYQPEPDGQDYVCRYEIMYADGVRTRRSPGIDQVQALLLAMQYAHTDLLAARDHDGRKITWLDSASLGLPIAQTIRDLDPFNTF